MKGIRRTQVAVTDIVSLLSLPDVSYYNIIEMKNITNNIAKIILKIKGELCDNQYSH